MAESAFSHPDDDLPRTLRRERDARQRAAAQPSYATPSRAMALDMPADGVAVTRFDVPFFRLAWFLMKCVIAGLPAIALLGAVLFGIGKVLETYFPWLLKMKIAINFLG